MLGIRRHNSNYQRAQSSMQLDTYYGDNSLHKRQYTGLCGTARVKPYQCVCSSLECDWREVSHGHFLVLIFIHLRVWEENTVFHWNIFFPVRRWFKKVPGEIAFSLSLFLKMKKKIAMRLTYSGWQRIMSSPDPSDWNTHCLCMLVFNCQTALPVLPLGLFFPCYLLTICTMQHEPVYLQTFQLSPVSFSLVYTVQPYPWDGTGQDKKIHTALFSKKLKTDRTTGWCKMRTRLEKALQPNSTCSRCSSYASRVLKVTVVNH